MTRRRVSNPLALAVLSCLNERPMHPYEISTTLRSRGKEQSIKLNYGSLYAVVDALQKHGLIAARETSREGRRPERTVYEISESGVTEFEDWLADQPTPMPRRFRSPARAPTGGNVEGPEGKQPSGPFTFPHGEQKLSRQRAADPST